MSPASDTKENNNMKTIYYGGVVYTGCEEFAEAFVVEDGLFSFVGSSAEALALACDGDERVDLGGAFVCPGFNDSHMHVLSLGQALKVAPLHMNTGSLEALLACFKEFIKNGAPRNGWIMGRGWNQDYFTDVKRMPNRYDLDTVSTEYPVVAVRACGHAMVVNSKALEMLGITADTPSPEGGQIVMENGEPNGILFDNAMDMVYTVSRS